MFCDLVYTVLIDSAESLDRAALSAGVDLSKVPRARVELDDELGAPIGRLADGYDALRKLLRKG